MDLRVWSLQMLQQFVDEKHGGVGQLIALFVELGGTWVDQYAGQLSLTVIPWDSSSNIAGSKESGQF